VIRSDIPFAPAAEGQNRAFERVAHRIIKVATGALTSANSEGIIRVLLSGIDLR
jgi:hypothetical protein